ncbi:hypothetical protein DFJ43DRAFT_431641 [Lentinula guzmanii]|uniref:Uncharacterized protein n=1 Tax=Lentinula guzmanii TaxID=2804957 RepID=A0AA38N0A2_9AGAR|nr:hypothetical protein DFJ43DRAFT_431641 [Lentinula guzmanii]
MQFRRSGTGLHLKGFFFTVMLGLISLVHVVALPVSGLDIRSMDLSELVRRDDMWLTRVHILTPLPEADEEKIQQIRTSTQNLVDITTRIQTEIRASIKIDTTLKFTDLRDVTKLAQLGRFVKDEAYFPEDKGKNVEPLKLDDPKYLKADLGIKIVWEGSDHRLTSYGGIYLHPNNTISVYFAFPLPDSIDIVKYGCARVVTFDLIRRSFIHS